MFTDKTSNILIQLEISFKNTNTKQNLFISNSESFHKSNPNILRLFFPV